MDQDLIPQGMHLARRCSSKGAGGTEELVGILDCNFVCSLDPFDF